MVKKGMIDDFICASVYSGRSFFFLIFAHRSTRLCRGWPCIIKLNNIVFMIVYGGARRSNIDTHAAFTHKMQERCRLICHPSIPIFMPWVSVCFMLFWVSLCYLWKSYLSDFVLNLHNFINFSLFIPNFTFCCESFNVRLEWQINY